MERFVVNLIDATRFKHFLSLLDVIDRLTLFLYDVEEERIRLLSLQVWRLRNAVLIPLLFLLFLRKIFRFVIELFNRLWLSCLWKEVIATFYIFSPWRCKLIAHIGSWIHGSRKSLSAKSRKFLHWKRVTSAQWTQTSLLMEAIKWLAHFLLHKSTDSA